MCPHLLTVHVSVLVLAFVLRKSEPEIRVSLQVYNLISDFICGSEGPERMKEGRRERINIIVCC